MGLNQLTDARLLRAKEEKLAQLMTASLAANTRRNYMRSIKKFIAAGNELPCSYTDIVRYLVDRAGIDSATELSHMVKALRFVHKLNNFVDPTDHARIRQVMAGIKRKYGGPVKRAKPFTHDDLLKMRAFLLSEDHEFHALRNIAMFFVGFFGALRGAELIRIEYRHLTFTAEGVSILLPRSKTDQTNKGQTVYLPRLKNLELCPVKALEDWLKISKIKDHYVFPAIWGTINIVINPKKAMEQSGFNGLIKRVAARAGLEEPEKYSSHSLRRGFATEAAKKGVSLFAIQKHGRWESVRNVATYVEMGRGFTDNATLAFDG